MLYVRIFKRFEPEEENAGNGDELAPLSFIMEEQKEKERSLAAAQTAAEGDAASTIPAAAEDADPSAAVETIDAQNR